MRPRGREELCGNGIGNLEDSWWVLKHEEKTMLLSKHASASTHCERDSLSLEVPSEQDVPLAWAGVNRERRRVPALVRWQ